MRDAASCLSTLGEQNTPLTEQMTENARVFENVADLVESDPHGKLQD